MKSVLISIQPKWCELIANGKKTVEVRKTKPKIDVPFKCYIYETKGKLKWCNKCKDPCERPYPNCACHEGWGKVIGEFVCDKIAGEGETVRGCTGLSMEELQDYCDGKDIYGWHISDLKIYDKPKELREFKSVKVINRYHKKEYDKYEKLSHSNRVQVTYFDRPPQSWCYVKELQNG